MIAGTSAAPRITLAAAVAAPSVADLDQPPVLCEVDRVHGREIHYQLGFPWGQIEPGAARLYVVSSGECGDQTLPRLKTEPHL